MSTPYEILGVSTSASQEDIKKSFKKLAMIHHPDKGGDPEKFKEINNAYQTLMNPSREKIHSHRGSGFNQGFNFDDIFNQDVFSTIFQQHGFHFNQQHQQRRNRTLRVHIALSLEEVFNGCEKTLNIRTHNGKEKLVNCKIPPGIDQGMTITYHKVGDDTIPSVPPGDIQVSIAIKPHEKFERNPGTLDLICRETINAFDAILGTKITVETIDNKSLSVAVPEGIQPNNIIKLTGMGLKDSYGNRGDQMIIIDVSIPNNLDDLAKKTLDEIRKKHYI